MWIRMGMYLFLLLCLGFWIQEAEAGNVTVCRNEEEYQECGSCESTCDHQKDNAACHQPCYPGCFCKPGLLRARDRSCVEPKDCNRSSCKENEEYLDCGSQCPLTCDNYLEPIFCTKPCKQGCFCKPRYVVGPDQKCTLPAGCPIGPCGSNELKTDCLNPCNTCSQRGNCYYEYCSRGCDCKPGYFRNSTGHCVREEHCDVQEAKCPLNEHPVSCVSLCNDCWSRGECDPLFCQPGCDCLPGYFRDENGHCVPESQCNTEGGYCGVNEEYSDCVVPCNDCNSRGRCQYSCESGCDCKSGFYRDETGVCIPADKCPEECGENEDYEECGSSCPPTCHNPYPKCAPQCNRGCFCKKGFIRGPDGRCVRNCPLVCGVNEEFQDCGSPCPLTCANLTATKLCPKVCVQGCVCKPGFVRGPTGSCIQPNECPSGKPVCGVYEEFQECGSPCPLTCANVTSPKPCINMCVQGCVCKSGYVRGPTGSCISPKECPPTCQENEVFLECGSSCQGSCENLGKVSESCLLTCRKGCYCKPQYVRGPHGKCILPQQCPIVCQENEVFQECGSPCQDTCENIGKAVSAICSFTCIKGCFCKPGYVRGPDGRCILPNHCPLVCPDNEVLLSCGSPCQRTCDNLNSASTPCVLPCIKGCFCKPGYVRGPNRFCILPTECPVVCGENEEFQTCGSACPATCQNATAPNACNLPCKKGCFCKPGFLRGPFGKCILPTACSVVCGKNEQFFECKSPCQPTCENQATHCYLPCLTGCFCKPGFVRDANGICIDPRSCPIGPCTKENEIFDTCGPACIRTCSRLEFRRQCPQQCVKGCFCKDGFVRDIESNCIQPQHCPKDPQMCPPNESFYACKPTCRDTCATLDFQGPCNDLCRPGCACRGGLVRDANNKCIPPWDCPGEISARKRGNESEAVTTSNPEISITVPFTKNPLPTLIEGTQTTMELLPKVTTQVVLTTSGIIPKITTTGVNNDETESTNTPNPVKSTLENVGEDKLSTGPTAPQQAVTTVKAQTTTIKAETVTSVALATDKLKTTLTNSKTFTPATVFGNTVTATTAEGIQNDTSTFVIQVETTSANTITQSTPTPVTVK